MGVQGEGEFSIVFFLSLIDFPPSLPGEEEVYIFNLLPTALKCGVKIWRS